MNITIFTLINLTVKCDAPEPWGFYFQDSASPIAEGIVELHDHILYFLIVILTLVTWMLITIINKEIVPLAPYYIKNDINNRPHVIKQTVRGMNHGSVIEVIWTIIPAIILVFIALPSFKLLYLIDEIIEPSVTVKAIGCKKDGLKLYTLNILYIGW